MESSAIALLRPPARERSRYVVGVLSGILSAVALLMPVGATGGPEDIPVLGQRSLSDIEHIELTYTDASPAPTVAFVRRPSVEVPVPTSLIDRFSEILICT